LQLREVENTIHKLGKAVGFIDNNLKIFCIILSGKLLHHLAVAAYHSKRGAKVVADVRKKFSAKLFDFRKLTGHTVERF